MWLHRQYEKIQDKDAGATEVAATSSIKSLWRNQGCAFVFGIVLGCLVVYGLAPKLFGPSTVWSQAKSSAGITLSCGDTAAEAKARGCEFDVLSYSWIPKDCRDRETDDEFREWLYSDERQLGPWPFFRDKGMKDRIPDANALSEWRRAVFTPQDEHIGHCIFLTRRLHRALDGRFRMDMRGRNLNHTIHCTNVVLNSTTRLPEEYATNRTHFKVTFEGC
jgi:hypothetical protein